MSPLLVVAGLVALGAGGLLNYQVNRFIRPRRRIPQADPSSVGLSGWTDVAFLTADGLELRAWFVPPQPGSATVILLHGLGKNRACWLGAAPALAQAGLGLLMFDLRNHGQSAGRLTSLGVHELEDVRAALAFLQARPEIDPRRIGIIGHSMGAALAIRAAARLPGLRAVVGLASFASLEENIQSGVAAFCGLRSPRLTRPLSRAVVWLAERQVGARVADLRPVDDLPNLKTPLLLVHGDSDPVVHHTNSLCLLTTRCQDTQLLLVGGAGHGSLLHKTYLGTYQRALLEFLQQNI